MYVVGVWIKTAKRYFKNVEEQFIRRQSMQGLEQLIYSASKTKKYLLKKSAIGNRLLFSELANTEFTCPENSNWRLLLPDSNFFLKFPNNFTAESWTTFSYGLLLQRFCWNFWVIFIISMKADTRNFSNKISAKVFTRRDFLWTVGSFYWPSMKSEYFTLLPNDLCCSLQSFAVIALKTKKLWRKIGYR